MGRRLLERREEGNSAEDRPVSPAGTSNRSSSHHIPRRENPSDSDCPAPEALALMSEGELVRTIARTLTMNTLIEQCVADLTSRYLTHKSEMTIEARIVIDPPLGRGKVELGLVMAASYGPNPQIPRGVALADGCRLVATYSLRRVWIIPTSQASGSAGQGPCSTETMERFLARHAGTSQEAIRSVTLRLTGVPAMRRGFEYPVGLATGLNIQSAYDPVVRRMRPLANVFEITVPHCDTELIRAPLDRFQHATRLEHFSLELCFEPGAAPRGETVRSPGDHHDLTRTFANRPLEPSPNTGEGVRRRSRASGSPTRTARSPNAKVGMLNVRSKSKRVSKDSSKPPIPEEIRVAKPRGLLPEDLWTKDLVKLARLRTTY